MLTVPAKDEVVTSWKIAKPARRVRTIGLGISVAPTDTAVDVLCAPRSSVCCRAENRFAILAVPDWLVVVLDGRSNHACHATNQNAIHHGRGTVFEGGRVCLLANIWSSRTMPGRNPHIRTFLPNNEREAGSVPPICSRLKHRFQAAGTSDQAHSETQQ